MTAVHSRECTIITTWYLVHSRTNEKAKNSSDRTGDAPIVVDGQMVSILLYS